MLACANKGNLGLRRGVVKMPEALRTRNFFSQFGEDYDFSDVPSTPFEDAPLCVAQSVNLLNQVGQSELSQFYEQPNQATVNGYMSEMDLNWHYRWRG